MINNKKVIALIPARSGSKGLLDKNIKLLNGKPLIAYSIIEASKSKYIDKIIVSTDSEKIAEISRKYRAEIPFIRPTNLANDSAKGIDVVLHAVKYLQSNKQYFDILVLLQPTSPLRTNVDIDCSIEYLTENPFRKAVISVCKVDHNPLWSNTLPDDLNMKNFIRENVKNKNRQDLPQYYRLNGAIFCAYLDYIIEKKSFISENTFAYIMPRNRSIDIDDEIDFKLAEIIMFNENKA